MSMSASSLVGWATRNMNPQPLYGMRAQSLWQRIDVSTAADRYRVMRAYYQCNALYDVLADLLRRAGVAKEAMKPLRNPTYRVVEFHAAHIWPGSLPDALPIMADRKSVVKPIQQVWKWSNWGSTKQVAARQLALYGDFFIKVATAPADDPQRVYFQMIEPEHVTDFDADERDYLTYVRLDIPQRRRRADGTTEAYTHTEEWNQTRNSFRVWEHNNGLMADIDELGTPTVDVPITSFGIDFVPISHGKFADVGDDRGQPAIMAALDKIDEANRSATRLHQQLWRHNDVTWALNGGTDASGRPLPPPMVNQSSSNTDVADGILTLGEEPFIGLPGNSQLESLVPNLNYDAALKVLQDHMRELVHDLPELAWYQLSDSPTLSGRAVRLLMAPAIARVEEARGNAEAALARADAMALTMGKFHNLFRQNIGSFERGDFEHSFEKRDVMPSDALEDGQANQAEALAFKAYVEAGVPVEIVAQEVWGWTPERAAQFTIERTAAIKREQALVQEDVPPDGMPPVQQ